MQVKQHALFLFIDGIGLGENDASFNPFVAAHLPTLNGLAGTSWIAESSICHSAHASFVPTDASMGVAGKPQSATGQAALLSGRNIPALLGYHWGPKPNAEVAATLQENTLFHRLRQANLLVRFANAYPDGYFAAIASGRRSYSAFPLALTNAGVALPTRLELLAGTAFSADFTGEGWRTELKEADAPIYSPETAGQRLAEFAQLGGLAVFECWMTDHLGHRGTLEQAVQFLQKLDRVLAGLLESWQEENGLLVICSDHGNLEDLRTRHHTENRVPTILLGRGHAELAERVHNLSDIANVFYHWFGVGQNPRE